MLVLHGIFAAAAGLPCLALTSSISPPSSSSSSSSVCAQLEDVVSADTTLECGAATARWSEYAAPQPGAIIRIGKEEDVSKVIRLANALDIPFLVQSGANGWADTFDLGPEGVVIDLSALKAISFNDERTEVSFQAGVLIGDLVAAAWRNDARVATGTCNCVSVLGAGLGVGVGRGTGPYGLGSDQLLRVNLVDAAGSEVLVTPESDPDLWWALGGAGPNFGVVTSAVYRSYPVADKGSNTAWTGLLVYDPAAQLEAVVAAIDALVLEPEMQLDFYFTEGHLAVLPFYLGSEADGRGKFASLLDLGPMSDGTGVMPYDVWNAAGDVFCQRGGRKPAYSANVRKLDPAAWRRAWDAYEAFYAANPEANQTTVLTECYSTAKSVEIGGEGQSAYPWRDVRCYAIAIPWYTSPELDDKANEFGRELRSIWAESSGSGFST